MIERRLHFAQDYDECMELVRAYRSTSQFARYTIKMEEGKLTYEIEYYSEPLPPVGLVPASLPYIHTDAYGNDYTEEDRYGVLGGDIIE